MKHYYSPGQDWIGAMFSFMGVMVMGIFMIALSRGITGSSLEPEKGDLAYLPGVIAMPRLPEEARGDFLFVEYVRDMLRLGESLSSQDIRLMWKGWKRSKEEQELRDRIGEFVKKHERDPLSPEAIEESERIEAEAKAAGFSDREFDRLWTSEVRRRYEAPGYLTQVTPAQMELMERYLELARDLAK